MIRSALVAVLAALPGVVAAAPPALDLAQLSKTMLACTDFDEYVNGVWRAATPIPADRSRIGSSEGLRDESRRVVEQALTDAMRDPALLDTRGKQLAANYYASGMDLASVERRGLGALQPLLAEIDALNDRSRLPALLALLARHRIAAPLAVYVQPDPKDKRRYLLHFDQSGLGLPDRDDYFRDDERTMEVRRAYDAYRTRLAKQIGLSETEAATASAATFAFETELAGASMTRVARRDPNAIYHLHSADSLSTLAPGLDWGEFVAALGVTQPGDINVLSPAFVQAVARAAADAPLSAWRAYLRQQLLDAAAPYLPADFVAARFEYRGRVIQGLQQLPPRVEQVITTLTGPFGSEPLAEGLGQLYVARAFSAQDKARAIQMVEDIKAAMRARIAALDWMSAPTKDRALRKLDAMALKIGYPDRWKSYDGLVIVRDDFAGNWVRANAFDFGMRLGDLGRPVDRSRWFASPHLVNAFAGGLNEIVFPAAILQPPFFNPQADDAVNYGGIGTVIGHEITHHFDDRGRQFDEVGNLADWWTAADADTYRQRAALVAEQFSGFTPLPGQAINGQQTLGENISDLGGVNIAYDGLQRALAWQPVGPIDGLTPAQRFYISYATIWRSKYRTEMLINQLRTGQHSPPRYRVLGPLANVPAFGRAFDCPPDAPMLRPAGQQISIW
jgi:predicted metalloendopeptidase